MADAKSRDGLILSQYEAGVPVEEIGLNATVCVKTVRNVARRAGLPPRNPSQPERDAKALDDYRAGVPVKTIAVTHGIGRSRVRILAAKAGLPPRSGWQRRYPIDQAVFDEPTSVGWWLIGLLAADGSIHAKEHRISLCQRESDADVLRAFYTYVGCPERPTTPLLLSKAVEERQWRRQPAAEARVFSKQLVEALEVHGVVPAKTASLRLGARASMEPAVWLGLLDGDGSVGVYRQGHAPRLMFSGTCALMKQCEAFWRSTLGFTEPRPAARPHSGGIWTFSLWGRKAVAASKVLLASSPISMRRKRVLLLQVAGRNDGPLLCTQPNKAMVLPERRHQWQPQI